MMNMMKQVWVVVLLVVVSLVEAKRGYWTQLQRVQKHELLSLRVALTQQNLDVLESTLYDRADPFSDNYGKWWTASQILDLVAPPASVSEAVVAYLIANGAQDVENHRDMIKFSIDAHLAESLFSTELYYFEHSNGRTTVVRTQDDYTIPSQIAQHVDFISGLKEFPVPRESKAKVAGVDKGAITVAHLQEMYSIPSTFPNNKDSSIGLIEFMNDTSYAESDLATFSQQMGIPNITVSHVVGPYNTSTVDLESSLDVQYGGAIALNASIWFWTVHEWMYEFATDLLTASATPLVVSMSWGWPEPLQCQVDPQGCGTGSSFQYVDRVNTEFAKIGLNGITLVAASGDQGAPGDGNYVCSNTTNPFSTIFPGASPYVLSVGATMLEDLLVEDVSATPPICSQTKCATTTREEVCSYPDALITSGGGFSNISPRPSYQDTVVKQYLSSGKLPDSGYFNNSNRGFPDVAGLGHNYVVFAAGAAESVDGTSCSSPVLAAIITLLNSERLNNGKSSLGFINPVIYAAYANNAQTFKDITKGNNKCTENCCMKTGYEASKGWDPVTGLGTPNFAALLTYVQSLK